MVVVRVSDGCDVYGGRGRGGLCMNNCVFPTRGWLGNPYSLSLGREVCIGLFRRDFLVKVVEDCVFGGSFMYVEE